MSYNGKMNFGLLGDFDAMPDLNVVARGITDSLQELRAAAGLRKPRRAQRRVVRTGTPAGSRSTSNGSSN
jgi:hypothetical protein